MVDPADALQDPVSSRAERGQIQRDWIAASADSGRQATEALGKAAEMLAGGIPGRRPDAELARAWAEIGQGWATLSHAEAARSIAAAAFAMDQGGLSMFPAWRPLRLQSPGTAPQRADTCSASTVVPSVPPSARATAHPAESASGWRCDPTVHRQQRRARGPGGHQVFRRDRCRCRRSEHLGGGRHQGAIARWARQRDRHPVALQCDCAHDHTLGTGTDILNAMQQGFVWRRRVRSGYRSSEQL